MTTHTTDAGTLFYLPGASTDTTQWKAERLQVVNWGGFEGRVVFDLHPNATLLSGASGAGKSTLLDAYTALMMDANTPFNGASNDGIGGRARSAGQRNLLSYLRGQTDTTTDEKTGRAIAKTLRGTKSATWGAIGMTFINDRGHRFTALRAFYVPASAVDSRTLTMRMLTYNGRLDLAELAEHVESRFAPNAMETAYPGMRAHQSYQAFSTALFARLGIGAHGDGDKALKLLNRIQAGHQIRTVDELYKEMVLEEPETFAHADLAITDFDNLETSYAALLTEEQKVAMLDPIVEEWNGRERARTEVETLDLFGVNAKDTSPLTLWSLQTHQQILDEATDRNKAAREAAETQKRTADQALARTSSALSATQEQHSQAGGAHLNQLTANIDRDEAELGQRRNDRATLESKLAALETPLPDQAAFDALTADRHEFTRTLEHTRGALESKRDATSRQQWDLAERQRLLRTERASYQGRPGRVDPALNAARDQMAELAGLIREQVPFVAELIDIAPKHERWRTAAEAVLASAARTMLVPAEHLEHFSVAINSHQLRRRITFEGVPAQPHREHLTAGDSPDRLVGKLLFKQSPYSTWVHEHLSATGRNALCIEDPRDLPGGGLRVLPSGQTRSGRTRGSHGINDSSRVIGFSNESALAEIDAELADLVVQLKPIEDQLTAIGNELAALRLKEIAYETLSNYTWERVDVDAVSERIAAARATMQDILASDDVLRALAVQVEHLKMLFELDGRDLYASDRRAADLTDEHARLVDDQDRVSRELEQIEKQGCVVLTEAQTVRLTAEFAAVCAPGDPSDLSRFSEHQVRLMERLRAGLVNAKVEVERRTATIEQVMRSYQLKWPDPNLGASITSYRDYATLLDGILSTGLHARREEWRSLLAQWSGQDLVPLAQSMETAIQEIRDRMGPVNDILSKLPFGPNGDRLSIHLRRLTPEHVKRFRQQLRHLSGTATRELSEAEMEKRFRQLQAFMAQLRHLDDPRYDKNRSDRARLLDVRRHVEITAERRDLEGNLLSDLRSLGGKSGGEGQELIAFIVGAALRFRLGDEENARPTFAPVFLDEGFVKSDARHTGRAVQAWKGLGFQLIIGAPLDKVSGLEPHMEHFLAITKNQQTHYSFVHTVRDRANRVTQNGATKDTDTTGTPTPRGTLRTPARTAGRSRRGRSRGEGLQPAPHRHRAALGPDVGYRRGRRGHQGH